MKGNNDYGPTPLKLESFANVESITGIITDVARKEFDGRPRWVVTIDDDLTLVINDTNYRAIKKVYGDESDDWLHQPITAYKGMLHYRGAEQEGICVRIPEADLPPREKVPVTGDLLKEAGDELKDDIPF